MHVVNISDMLTHLTETEISLTDKLILSNFLVLTEFTHQYMYWVKNYGVIWF